MIRRFRRTYRTLILAVLISFVIGILFGMYVTTKLQFKELTMDENVLETLYKNNSTGSVIQIHPKFEPPSLKLDFDNQTNIPLNYNVHTFYYPWYGNPKMNGHYIHWNHIRLSHWVSLEDKKYSHKSHVPPDDIGSNYYPWLGLYSSSDTAIIHRHMKMMKSAGIGVLVMSWYHPIRRDAQGISMDHLMPTYLDIAEKYKIQIAIHLEPYPGRTVRTVQDDLKHIIKKYYFHPALHRRTRRSGHKPVPVVYVYDSYIISEGDWKYLLGGKTQHMNIRETSLDAYVVGLLMRQGDCESLGRSGFDAAYTYFATQSNSWASSSHNWPRLAQDCKKQKVAFFPSIGPGYIDTAVRPWNSQATVPRRRGAYYRSQFWRAMRSGLPETLGISTFNEWHEGTQIEPAIPFKNADFTYLSYEPHRPDFYLKLTGKFVEHYTIMQMFHNVTIPDDDGED